jgi:hypothetical protein
LFVASLALISWRSPPETWVLLCLLACVQLLGFFVSSFDARERRPSVPPATRTWLSRSWLIPVLGPSIGYLGSWVAEPSARRTETLSFASFTSLRSEKRFSRWHRLPLRSGRPAPRERPQAIQRDYDGPSGLVDQELYRLRIARLGTVLVALDALAVGWVLASLTLAVGLGSITAFSLGALLGLCWMVLSILAWAAGAWFSKRHRGLWVLVALFTLVEYFLGSLTGIALVGDPRSKVAAEIWGYGHMFSGPLAALFWMRHALADPGGPGQAHAWFFFGLSFVLIAAVIPLAVPTVLHIVFPAFPFLPLLALLVRWLWCRRVRDRVLHPFHPTDTRDPSLPLATRLGVGFVKATLALPLGGLFVPFWPAVFHLLEKTAGPERRRRWGASTELGSQP